jgi:hypothetical protein
MTTNGALPGCLDGVRVLDLTQFEAGLPAPRRNNGHKLFELFAPRPANRQKHLEDCSMWVSR